MTDRGREGDRGRRPPPGPKGGRRPGGVGPPKRGGLRLRQLGGGDFALDHPPCVGEMELDYVEGIEMRAAGDPEGARDALRYALQGCGDNLWVHVALGRIALEDFRDADLARGHFGYGLELARRAIPPGFEGRLPPASPANRPAYDAIDGLAASLEALGRAAEAAQVRALGKRWAEGPRT